MSDIKTKTIEVTMPDDAYESLKRICEYLEVTQQGFILKSIGHYAGNIKTRLKNKYKEER